MGKYIDYKLIDEVPNKYNLTPKDIKKLHILNWEKLKKKTWENKAMLNGTWWCYLEGCHKTNQSYNDEDEFWIGFREEDGKIKCRFSSYGGMCGYEFKKFYDIRDIENEWDMQVQVNALRYLNELIDEGILGK